MSKVEANEYGVRWATAKSGTARIAVQRKGSEWTVWTIQANHNISRRFNTEAKANAFANNLFRTAR